MRKNLLITLFVVAASLCIHSSFAQEENLSLIAKSQYFSIYGHRDIDISELLTNLNFNYFFQAEGFSDKSNQDPKSILIKTIDALYLEVSDILGIHIYSFHGNIKFYSNQLGLNEVFRNYFKEDFPERCFYFHNTNTIYVSFPDLTLGMAGHEIAHAILSHYFVIPPSNEVQEILAGYVEYNLRKSTGTLP